MAEQEKREDSVLSYYKKLIALKKSPEYKETLTYGRFVADCEESGCIFAYHRVSEENGQDILVAANYGTDTSAVPLKGKMVKALLSNAGKEELHEKEGRDKGEITLESCQAAVILLES